MHYIDRIRISNISINHYLILYFQSLKQIKSCKTIFIDKGSIENLQVRTIEAKRSLLVLYLIGSSDAKAKKKKTTIKSVQSTANCPSIISTPL